MLFVPTADREVEMDRRERPPGRDCGDRIALGAFVAAHAAAPLSVGEVGSSSHAATVGVVRAVFDRLGPT